MHKYCLDTSGVSNPLAMMPEDIYSSLWGKVIDLICSGVFCCNAEIAEQYTHIEGPVGECLNDNISDMLYEIEQDHWDWRLYIAHVTRMSHQYRQYISDYNNNRKNTVDLDDVSIVALAKTLGLPVVSMEGLDRGQLSATKMRIPRLCECEGVKHHTFNELLRLEGINI
jgi:hypothetical protein